MNAHAAHRADAARDHAPAAAPSRSVARQPARKVRPDRRGAGNDAHDARKTSPPLTPSASQTPPRTPTTPAYRGPRDRPPVAVHAPVFTAAVERERSGRLGASSGRFGARSGRVGAISNTAGSSSGRSGASSACAVAISDSSGACSGPMGERSASPGAWRGATGPGSRRRTEATAREQEACTWHAAA